jgi:hypothetical protein
MASLALFISWAASPDPNRLAIADDPDALRREDQQRLAAVQLWDSWALTHLGTIVNNSGTSGRAQLPADRLDDIDTIRRQVSGLLDSQVGIGVGLKVSEADAALKAAIRRGSDCIILYTQDLQSEIETSKDEGLSKAQPAANQGAGAGFGGKTQPGGPAGAQSPTGQASAHSQGETAQANLEAMPEPEMTHAAADFEQQFNDHADAHDQREEETKQATAAGQGLQDLKQQVVKILQGVKEQAPQLELMRETEPELYGAVQGLIKTLILMAQQLADGQLKKSDTSSSSYSSAKVEVLTDPMLKAQRFFAQAAFMSKSGQVQGTGPMHDVEALPADFEVAMEGFLGLDGLFYDRHTAAEMTGQENDLHSEDLGKAECKHFYGRGTRCLRCKADKVEPEISAAPPRGPELNKGRDVPAKNHQGIGEGGVAQPGAVGSLSQAEKGPMPEDEAHYHPKNLPVGSQKDAGPTGGRDVGTVKIRHADDGKTAWVGVRAGQVMSQDGHPISSRNPGGR